MGLCHGKPIEKSRNTPENAVIPTESEPVPHSQPSKSSNFPFYSPSPLPSLFKNSPANSSVSSTPLRIFRRPFPPPSPAKHIRALLARRHGSVKPNEASIPEGSECEIALDKNFGFSKQFIAHYELGEEVGRGHFGYTCSAKAKKGSSKGQDVAVKVIPKSKMTTAIAIEDVRREVKILRALTGHKNLVQFYDAYEDEDNVYVVMELCKGGELLDRILSRGGKYSEDDAKVVMVQILSVVAYCHLQGVVHRDLKPENFLFTSKDDNSPLKAIDFGLSDYVKPDERLNDIVGSAYYVAPEVLHRSYGTEGDMWSIGVIAYILLCGSRPFWARTESGIFRAVLKADPSFDEAPWPSMSSDAIDFVKRLLNKDYRKRLTASQALRSDYKGGNCQKYWPPHFWYMKNRTMLGSHLHAFPLSSIAQSPEYCLGHPWLASHHDVKIPLDMVVYKLVKAYVCSSSLRKSALGALAKSLTVAQLAYLREQFTLLGPNKSGFISMQNFKLQGVIKNSTDAMKDSRTLDYANMVSSIQYRKLDFEEFCAAAISVHQLEGMESWEQHARLAYELFEKDGNRPIMIEELASELGLGPSVPVHVVLQDWIRHSDGKLSFLGFVRLLHDNERIAAVAFDAGEIMGSKTSRVEMIGAVEI
ncbi:CDPK-related kinase 1 [Morella rubra]|uniref:non-specific serine/threonine protein kinase n=1 Tax=Morella rubra TaxID=262757 RepID=A0A6A1WAA9_9ROSI|nr:CDPK-related kinase 1 [Morella rubra]KAB1222207.1 CDPK-related kinase 1 [Morella rubra]